MIESVLFGICLMLGFTVAKPLAPKGLVFIAAPPTGSSRPVCAEKTLTFCENVDNYPAELIETLLKSKKFDLNDFIADESEGLEEPPEFVLMRPAPTVEARTRNSRSSRSSNTGEEMAEKCSVPSKMVSPKIASNSKGEWRFIAQAESSKIHQQVEVHMCSENKECQKSCTQFYTPISMKSVANDDQILEDIFWFPSSCRCFNSLENLL